MKEAGLEGRCLHGLRKSATETLAELGLTNHQIMAITGHTTLKEVDRYTKDAERRRMAESGYGSLNDQFTHLLDEMQG